VGWGLDGSRACTRLREASPALPRRSPETGPGCGCGQRGRRETASAVDTFGFSDAYGDWRDLVARNDIDLVSLTGPNFIHREVAVAAAEAGKHVWVEKPAGRNAAETRAIRDAVRANGVQSAAGFNYRNVPAVEMARQLIADGRLGRINHVYIRLLADYAAHPDSAQTSRFTTEWSGSGVLGDPLPYSLRGSWRG
jgi:predicted dehydrogenase